MAKKKNAVKFPQYDVRCPVCWMAPLLVDEVLTPSFKCPAGHVLPLRELVRLNPGYNRITGQPNPSLN